jgi:hypothetical protein
MLSYAAWQKYFGQNNDVISKVIRLDDIPYTVIGVMPQGFQRLSSTQWWPCVWNEDGALPTKEKMATCPAGRVKR